MEGLARTLVCYSVGTPKWTDSHPNLGPALLQQLLGVGTTKASRTELGGRQVVQFLEWFLVVRVEQNRVRLHPIWLHPVRPLVTGQPKLIGRRRPE